MKYCKNCRQMVEPEKSFNIAAFFLGLIFLLVGAFIYLIYWAFKPAKCPICHSINWRE